jgi:non-specific serine/threonine protein kinase
VSSDTPSIAVLYLEDLSGAPDAEFFRDGMTEDITTELAKIQSLRVFPRASVIPFRDRSEAALEVGRELSASHILSGSVRRAGERLRITLQMIECESGLVTWAERYDREIKDVFAVQEDVAKSVAQALQISLSPHEKNEIAQKPTANLEAYDYFLRGRMHTRRQNRELALEMFERALKLDPNFALAHAGIANICAMQYYLKHRTSTWLDRARAEVERAFMLIPDLPEGYVALARILYAEERYADAEVAARKAIAIKPDCESSWDLLGRALFASGRWDEAAARAPWPRGSWLATSWSLLRKGGRADSRGFCHRRGRSETAADHAVSTTRGNHAGVRKRTLSGPARSGNGKSAIGSSTHPSGSHARGSARA